jgi:hypothetical protein
MKRTKVLRNNNDHRHKGVDEHLIVSKIRNGIKEGGIKKAGGGPFLVALFGGPLKSISVEQTVFMSWYLINVKMIYSFEISLLSYLSYSY